MKVRRSLLLPFVAISTVLTPVAQIRALAPTADAVLNNIEIVSQPFNVGAASNSQFVVKAPDAALADRNDRLEFQLHRRVSTREALRAIAKGDAESRITDTVSLRLSRVQRAINGSLVASIPILQATNNQVSLLVNQDGIYPITVRIIDDKTGSVLASVLTFINRRSASTVMPSVTASTFLSLTNTPSLSPQGVFTLNDDLRLKVQRFIDYLTANVRAATIYIQPEIVAALGTSTDPQDALLLQALRTQLRARTITSSTFAPVDVSLFANSGLEKEFAQQLQLGEATLTKYLVDIKISRATWVSYSPITNAGLALLRKSGISGLVLLDGAQAEANFQARRGVLARTNGPIDQFLSVVSLDPEIVSTLSSPSVALHNIYQAASEILMERDDLLASGVQPAAVRLLFGVANNSIVSFNAVETVARVVSAAPGINSANMIIPETVTEATAAIDFSKVLPAQDSVLRTSLTNSRVQLDAVSSMFAEGDIGSDTLSYLLGIASSTITKQSSDYTQGLSSSLAQLRDAVTVTTPREVTLSGRKSIIRLQVRNDSKSDLTVVVRLSSVKLFLENPIRRITLPAGSTTEVNVPATTRTNGRFPIGIKVITPRGGVDVVPYRTITAKVNAIAGLGQLVSVTLLLVLLAWWWSHFRKTRRNRGSEPSVGTTVSEL